MRYFVLKMMKYLVLKTAAVDYSTFLVLEIAIERFRFGVNAVPSDLGLHAI